METVTALPHSVPHNLADASPDVHQNRQSQPRHMATSVSPTSLTANSWNDPSCFARTGTIPPCFAKRTRKIRRTGNIAQRGTVANPMPVQRDWILAVVSCSGWSEDAGRLTTDHPARRSPNQNRESIFGKKLAAETRKPGRLGSVQSSISELIRSLALNVFFQVSGFP